MLERRCFLGKKEKHVYPVLDAMLALKKETLKDLIQILGTDYSSISLKINGHRDFTFSEASSISEHFGVPVDFLFSATEKPFMDAINNFLKRKTIN